MTPRYPVIALSGIPGAGKTRASQALAARIGALYLPFDAFERLTDRDPAEVLDWLHRGAPWDEMYDPALDGELAARAAEGPVVLETPLGRLPPPHSARITRAIWIEVDRDIALARKLSAALAPQDWDTPAEMSAWVAGFLAQYEELVRPCLEMQAARVKPLADHVIDGMAAPEAVVEQIIGLAGPFVRRQIEGRTAEQPLTQAGKPS